MTAHLFGEHLKREREMRGISLEEISAATRISVRFLEALENEQWERLPGGIFNRGFIRSVAHFLGLDEEGLIAEYALETHERPEIAVWTKEPVQPRPNWAAIISVFIIMIALAGGAWFVHQRYGAAIGAWHQRHPFIKTVLARVHRERSTSGGEANGGADAPSQVQTRRQASNPSQPLASPATAGPAAIGARKTGGQATNSASPDTTAMGSGSSKEASQITIGVPLVLKVEAGETSNVSVIADGKPVFSGRLNAQRTLQFKAQKSFTVTSSNSNAVLLELNGNTVPPLGPPGQPGKITLTRENLKPGPGDGN